MEVMQGSDFSISVTFTNRSNSAIDLDGCDARVMVKKDISDGDSDALVSLTSSSNPDSFDLSSATSGRVVVTVGGNYTAGVNVNKKLKVFAQVEAALDGHYYRSENIPFDMIEAVFSS
jgi:hypothetical protein